MNAPVMQYTTESFDLEKQVQVAAFEGASQGTRAPNIKRLQTILYAEDQRTTGQTEGHFKLYI